MLETKLVPRLKWKLKYDLLLNAQILALEYDNNLLKYGSQGHNNLL